MTNSSIAYGPPYPTGASRAEIIDTWLQHIGVAKTALARWQTFLSTAIDQEPARVDTDKTVTLSWTAYLECQEFMAKLETSELARLEEALTGRHYMSLQAKQALEAAGYKNLTPFLETIVQEYPNRGEQLLAMIGGLA